MAMGSRMINNGFDKEGNNHLRMAPSNINKIKYSQMAAFNGSLNGYLLK